MSPPRTAGSIPPWSGSSAGTLIRPVLQHVVEKAVFFVPQALAFQAAVAHGMGDVEEVLPELAGNVLIAGFVFPQLHGNGQQVQGVHCHPTGSIGLFEVATGRQRGAAIEDADIVQPEEAALDRKSTRLNSSHSSISYA